MMKPIMIRTTVALSSIVLTFLIAPKALAVPRFTIVPLGFDNAEHTRDDGYKYNIVDNWNEAELFGNCAVLQSLQLTKPHISD